MKIIEALKELPLIEKRIAQMISDINQYASLISSEEPALGTEDAHKKKVKGLKQKAFDLIRHYEKIKNTLEKTNCKVVVEIEGVKKTIREWITVRKDTGKLYSAVFDAFNIKHATDLLNSVRIDVTKEGVNVSLKRMYSEDEIKQEREKSDLIISRIDAALEVVNATTDLVEIIK